MVLGVRSRIKVLGKGEDHLGHQQTIMLNTLPEESLQALKTEVAKHFDWRISTGEKAEQPRFLIERQVGYDLTRFPSRPMQVGYRVEGRFRKTPSGETALEYDVSGDGGMLFLYKAVVVIGLIVLGGLLLNFAFSLGGTGSWIGMLIFLILAVSGILYGRHAYRTYHRNLRAMDEFMKSFAARMGG